ncbi:hypothetical protein NQZ68_035404 [Dissostichus eleginoides]|nr:hypothetical protein NQZ68_035404 [Dissostichus eleginoides]
MGVHCLCSSVLNGLKSSVQKQQCVSCSACGDKDLQMILVSQSSTQPAGPASCQSNTHTTIAGHPN